MKTRWKILITIALAVLFWKLAYGMDHRPIEGHLKDTYMTLNDQYFYGALPVSKTKIVIVDLTQYDDVAKIDTLDDGEWLISIDKKMNPIEKQAEMSLIHEMCHQYDFVQNIDEGLSGHNEKWYGCMLRVAEAGGMKDRW